VRINEQERNRETHFVTHCDRVPKYITINILLVYSLRISCNRSILFLCCFLSLFSALFFMLGVQIRVEVSNKDNLTVPMYNECWV
jgi:hypothetical protein